MKAKKTNKDYKTLSAARATMSEDLTALTEVAMSDHSPFAKTSQRKQKQTREGFCPTRNLTSKMTIHARRAAISHY